MLKRIAKHIAYLLFGPYKLNRIYFQDLKNYSKAPPQGGDIRRIDSAEQIAASPDPLVRDHAWFAGDDAYAFGLWDRGELVCTCIFWTHRRLRDTSILKLAEHEAVLVALVTAAGSRGRGYAGAVIRFAEIEMKKAGFERLYSWVWHTNGPSRRAFEKAGWTYIAFVANVTPVGCGKPLRFERRVRLV